MGQPVTAAPWFFSMVDGQALGLPYGYLTTTDMVTLTVWPAGP